MGSIDMVRDAFERIRDTVHPAANGLSESELTYRVDAEANSIAWLVWHLTRIQDDHVAGLAGTPQVWTENGWFERFDLPFDASDTGYGHDPDAVAAVRVGARELLGYFEDVHAATTVYLDTLGDEDLDRVVDRSWDPPVTVGVRLVSVVADDLQHVGQAAFIRGIVHRH